MTEKSVIVSLICSRIEQYKMLVLSYVDSFYQSYDPSKSLDRSMILNLLSDVHSGLLSLEENLYKEYV